MTTPDVNVVLLDFPNSQKEMVVPNEDGSFTILINAKHTTEQQAAAYDHAMEHIRNSDFQKKDVQQIEQTAHNLTVSKKTENIAPASSDTLDKIMKRIRRERRKLQNK